MLPLPCRCVLVAVLLAAAGCQTPEMSPAAANMPRPLPAPPAAPPDGRMLLKTGAIQLGPGVGRNLWGWQGDGLGGF
jgi:hypothetical protein